MGDKNRIRKRILEQRNRLEREQVEDWSFRIAERLFEQNFFRRAQSIFVYLAFRNEVGTAPIIERALADHKKVGVPKLNGHVLTPVCFKSWETFAPGEFGILEPLQPEPFVLTEETVVLVPGVVFDRRGHRVGFGKGFYDRFLEALPCLKVGLAYEFQLVEKLPEEKHDVPMDWIITEEQIIDCRSKP